MPGLRELICTYVAVFAFFVSASTVDAELVRGGGSKKSDCISVFDVPSANKPAPPKAPKHVDCVDGDLACDIDGERNGRCVFDVSICLNSDSFIPDCTPEFVDEVVIDHAEDNGDPKFDTEFQALQQRVNLLEFPDNLNLNDCTLVSSITVRLKGPNGANKMSNNKKVLRMESDGTATSRSKTDRDKIKFKCRAEGDRVYLPLDLYDGTFDRIGQQVFAASCAVSACHDDESNAGGLNLLPINAYGQLVGVAPFNAAAAGDGLLRVDGSGDFDNSFLYRKITGDLLAAYGSQMPFGLAPLDPEIIDLIRLWILGDGLTGPAPQTGWVAGTTGE